MPDTVSHRSKFWLYAVLGFVLLACLWTGWRDFDPWLSQQEIRQSIRSAPRWLVQVLVQFLAPTAILFYFGSEAVAKLRNKRQPPGGPQV